MLLKAPKNGCVIRMYRHGFGDCFLLAFGAKNGRQHYVLIDCGVLLGTPDAEAIMTTVARDIIAATDGHLHVLVITHEHWDHLSGFVQAQSEFEKIQVDKLWLAWTEDPDDPLATALRQRQRKALQALQSAVSRLGATNSVFADKLSAVADFFGREIGLDGRTTTETAFKWIKNQWTNKQFCRPGMPPMKIKGLPGIRFFVLGPPADKKYLHKSRPSKRDSEVYLDNLFMERFETFFSAIKPQAKGRYAFSSLAYEDETFTPFNPAYGLNPGSNDIIPVHTLYESEEWRKINDNWLELAGELALNIDNHANNTSLVLAIEHESSGKVLLFTGDAQVGNWLSWENLCWEDNQKVIKSSDLLNRTIFYKVGHHGSHNATLKTRGLEMMNDSELIAAIPVDRKIAAERKWHMPYQPLYERLIEMTNGRVILADEGTSTDHEGVVNGHLKHRVAQNEHYMDITIGFET